jgi:hypothetical protein
MYEGPVEEYYCTQIIDRKRDHMRESRFSLLELE